MPLEIGCKVATLLDAIEEHSFDALMGGARRDEEKARAKERFFSHRDDFGRDPKTKDLNYGISSMGRRIMESTSGFSISNWTEMDVWQYILMENIKIPSLYIAHNREVVWRNNT